MRFTLRRIVDHEQAALVKTSRQAAVLPELCIPINNTGSGDSPWN